MELLPHLKKIPVSEADWFEALANLARYLRSPEGCPWDREQTALSFARFAVEESGEYVEALEKNDAEDVPEEFGDALFVLLASAAAAEEEGRYRIEDALRAAHEKMVRRHAHVFGPERTTNLDEIVASWDRIKAEERRKRDR